MRSSKHETAQRRHEMSSQNRWTGRVVGVILGLLFSAVVVLAGVLEPSVGPTAEGSQMYTLEQIYDRLNTGATGNKMKSFTDPNSGPAGTGHTLDEIMGKLPALDNGGAGTAHVVAGKTYWGLTSGEWGLRTGTNPLAGVARTGQTPTVPFTAADGSDGDLQKGVVWPSPRFTNNGNGTVTDHLTGLIWLQNANCANALRDWTTALRNVMELNLVGTMNSKPCGDTSNSGSHQTDWRLPNVKELQSLIDFAYENPALSNAAGTAKWSTAGDAFIGVQSDYYWSSSTHAASTDIAWYVYLYGGNVNGDNKTAEYYVWPVRGGQ
jgi:hypothetical protein